MNNLWNLVSTFIEPMRLEGRRITNLRIANGRELGTKSKAHNKTFLAITYDNDETVAREVGSSGRLKNINANDDVYIELLHNGIVQPTGKYEQLKVYNGSVGVYNGRQVNLEEAFNIARTRGTTGFPTEGGYRLNENDVGRTQVEDSSLIDLKSLNIEELQQYQSVIPINMHPEFMRVKKEINERRKMEESKQNNDLKDLNGLTEDDLYQYLGMLDETIPSQAVEYNRVLTFIADHQEEYKNSSNSRY